MDTPTFTVIRTTRTVAEADMLITALRSAGLHPVDLDTSSHISLAGADVSYHVEVPGTEVEEAKAFLDSYSGSTPSA